MSKRGADNYLTDQNWDQEAETEEAGVFKQADENVLQTRQVKKAKRRFPASEDSTEKSTGVFKGFTGFAGFSKTTDSSTTGFAALGSKSLNTNGSGTSNSNPVGSTAFGATLTTQKSEASDSKLSVPSGQPVDTDESSRSPSGARTKYLHQLKSLNEGVTKWIKEHVNKNPYCILTPIFKDYEKYLSDIEKKYPRTEENLDKKDDSKEKVLTKECTPQAQLSQQQGNAVSSGGFTLSSKNKDAEDLATTTVSPPPVFSFGSAQSAEKSNSAGVSGTETTSTPATQTTFSGFKTETTSAPATQSSFSGFKFGNTTTSLFGQSAAAKSEFSFASVQKKDPSSASTEENQGEEEYVPPKTDVTAVTEEDALYTKRCKLFFKKEDQWKEKGVGNLHLKPCGEKTQFLIRADTNLGNVLLNIMLSSSLPISRQGKNNVAIVCIPNPPLDEKKPDDKTMVHMLIRVKTSEDADELFEKLKENKR